MTFFRNSSLRFKLTLVLMLTSAVALLIATTAAVGYEFLRFRYERLLDLTAQGEVIEAGTAVALATRDVPAARKILGAMRTQHEVVSARIFDSEGRLFAEYVRPDATALPVSEPVREQGYGFAGRHVLFYHSITLDGRAIGTLVLRSDLQQLESRFLGGAAILVVVMLASFPVALFIGTRFQRNISCPILDLAGVARSVADKKDYSLRAVKESDDEIGVLVDGFNQMLTQIQQQDAELRDSEQRFSQLAGVIREVFWLSDAAKEQILYVSPGYEKIWERSRGSLYAAPRDWVEAIHPEDRRRVLDAALTRQASGKYDEEYRIRRPDGSIRWIHDRGFPVLDEAGKVYRIAGIAEDITGRKELEKRLLEVTDLEKARIGQDIHDGLSQQLVGAALNLTLLKEDLLAWNQAGIERVDKIAALLDDAISRARDLARGLYPIKLETEGLLPALQEMAVKVTRQSKINCQVENSHAVPLLETTELIHLYRIAQEAVNNAVRHSGAKRIWICLTAEEDRIRLSVSDDGVGLPVENNGFSGMGLHIMRYRASMIGGVLALQSGKAGGANISCVFQPKSVRLTSFRS